MLFKTDYNEISLIYKDKYLATNWTRFAASAVPSFTTLHKAKAVWIILNRADSYGMVYTNVNPTTGEINPNYLTHRCWSRGNTDTQNWASISFGLTITDNSVVTSNALGGANVMDGLLIYSYED